MPVVTTGFVHLPCPITVVGACASSVGLLHHLDEFASTVHQEQDTAEQVVHVPIPQIQEQCGEGVNVIPQERLPERTGEYMVAGAGSSECGRYSRGDASYSRFFATHYGREFRGYAAPRVVVELCCCPESGSSYCSLDQRII